MLHDDFFIFQMLLVFLGNTRQLIEMRVFTYLFIFFCKCLSTCTVLIFVGIYLKEIS